ncbi:CMRF35-like molecule 1 [Electrophorus electricus]|uniref:CMRF35-like molecule 1 n=1 Tax=Electrophorus electricus TaxID=8005 RepID=UPI0015D0A0A1|nr:CMRF35-like molecule 1 [Electrophorus electricus]
MYFCMVLILLSEVRSVASTVRVTGQVGGFVMISCSHRMADDNKKYFCRKPCKTDKDILIKSDQSSTTKYKLKDLGDGRFTVNITELQKTDSGTYWCGVERWFKDTYIEVLLTVTEVTAVPQTVTSSEPSTSTTTIISPFTTENNVSNHQLVSISLTFTGTLLYTVIGLVVMVNLFGVSMITLYKYRKTIRGSQTTASSDVIYSVIQIPRTNHNNQTGATSSTTEFSEETMKNPLYDNDALLERRRDSNIYTLPQ